MATIDPVGGPFVGHLNASHRFHFTKIGDENECRQKVTGHTPIPSDKIRAVEPKLRDDITVEDMTFQLPDNIKIK